MINKSNLNGVLNDM